MASGTAVVATPNVGAREVLDEGQELPPKGLPEAVNAALKTDQVPLQRGEVGVVKHEGLDRDRGRQGDDGQLDAPEAQGGHADEDPDGGGKQGRDEQGPGEPEVPVHGGFR